MSIRTAASFTLGLTVVATLLTSGSACADRKLTRAQVPAPVLAAFEKAYPKATVRGYEMDQEDGTTLYEIASVEGGKTREVSYRPDGSVSEVEEAMAPGALPAGVVQAVGALIPKATIRRAERVTRGDVIQYEVGLLQGTKKSERVFDATGKAVK